MKPLPIRSISASSLANIIAVYYAIAGTITTMLNVVEKTEKLSAPLGLPFPFLSLKINLAYARSETPAGMALQLFLFMLVYGLSGWLTGFVGATVYNLLSKHFRIQVKGNLTTPDVAIAPFS